MKNLELAKKLAVLGMIFHAGLISEIRECRTSGQTVTAWCEAHDVNSKSYYYWLRKVRAAACESLPIVHKKSDLLNPASSNKAVFAQIPLPDPEIIDASVVLRLNGATLEIRNGASDKVIENMLRAIRNLC
jgi:transposase-like protein